ncbi:fucose permease [Yimella lutea]|uniref:Fucose permease n=1 Tax=Yimella lutea TaxID=587872 RepID=A0A542EGN8_9MICO|nr:MFS transporter [Yimella lutea]TQJ14488.1 fucose permease [Yimella lutea]
MSERTRQSAGSGRPEETAPTEPTLRSNYDFTKFWFGQGVSLLGSQMTLLALPLAAITVFSASSGEVGLLRFVETIPYLFFALPFGVWVDRRKKKPVMITANALRMLLLLAVPVLAHFDLLTVHVLLVIAGAVGVFSVLFEVTWMSYIPTLVKRRDHLVDANQRLGVTQSTTDLAGPGLAGLLIGWVGPITVLVVDSVSYLLSLVTMAFVRAPEEKPEVSPDRSFTRELSDGVTLVFRHTVLRPLALIAPFTNMSLTCISTLFLLYGVRNSGLTPAEIGTVFSVSAVGALLGALVSKRLLARFPVGPLYGAAMLALYAAPLPLTFADGAKSVVMAVFAATLMISYFGSGLSNVIQLSLRQTCTPTPMMGRMSAAFRTLLFGGAAVGALIAGFLGESLGVEDALRLVTICSALLVLPILMTPVVRLRDVSDAMTTEAP